MADVVKIIVSGRLTKDPEVKSYGNGKKLTSFNIASSVGFKDNKKTLFFNCTAFEKSGEAIAEYFRKGDQIFLEGEPTQNKVDDKVFHGINVHSWTFGSKKKTDGDNNEPRRSEQTDTGEENPFNDSDIPF